MSDGFKSATFDDASNATEAIELAGSNRIIVVNEACQGGEVAAEVPALE